MFDQNKWHVYAYDFGLGKEVPSRNLDTQQQAMSLACDMLMNPHMQQVTKITGPGATIHEPEILAYCRSRPAS